MESDQGLSVNTGIAVMNLESEEVELQITLLNSEGVVQAESNETLAAGDHLAKFITEFEWTPTLEFANFTGLMRVQSSGTIAATVLQTRPDKLATMPIAGE